MHVVSDKGEPKRFSRLLYSALLILFTPLVLALLLVWTVLHWCATWPLATWPLALLAWLVTGAVSFTTRNSRAGLGSSSSDSSDALSWLVFTGTLVLLLAVRHSLTLHPGVRGKAGMALAGLVLPAAFTFFALAKRLATAAPVSEDTPLLGTMCGAAWLVGFSASNVWLRTSRARLQVAQDAYNPNLNPDPSPSPNPAGGAGRL